MQVGDLVVWKTEGIRSSHPIGMIFNVTGTLLEIRWADSFDIPTYLDTIDVEAINASR